MANNRRQRDLAESIESRHSYVTAPAALKGHASQARALTVQTLSSHITSMALSRKKATTIALDPDDDRLLSRAARARGISRSEVIRPHLALVLEQYRRHPKPRSAGIVRALAQRGDERELFGGRP